MLLVDERIYRRPVFCFAERLAWILRVVVEEEEVYKTTKAMGSKTEREVLFYKES